MLVYAVFHRCSRGVAIACSGDQTPPRLHMIQSSSPNASGPSALFAGLALAAAVAAAATAAEWGIRLATGGRTLPAIVLALVIGIALHPLAQRPFFPPGLSFAVQRLLRIAIALLGVRIALADIVALGPATAALIVVAMAMTVALAMALALRLKIGAGYGALAGAANAVCGASAALATASVVPEYPDKNRDVVFAVVAANAVSTAAMLLYPPLATLLGFDDRATGILLGGTIHDMAQVVGAGYAVSDPVGNAAVLVKLFRIFLLLPVVLAIGAWFSARTGAGGAAKVPVPVFALVFLALCAVNSIVPAIGGLDAAWGAIKSVLTVTANLGLLLAIAALGLSTSVGALFRIGWRHIAVFMAATLVLLLVVSAALCL